MNTDKPQTKKRRGIWFRGHHYHSQIGHTLITLTHWWNIKGLLKALWRGEKYLTWFGHADDCCDYWTPVDSHEAQRAFMLDDELGLKGGKDT